MGDILSDAQLNRATLARQHLLERSRTTVPRMVEHLVGLQAQEPLDPYVALWSRLSDFEPGKLGRLIERGDLVRLTLMRGTIHLVTARDAWALRPLVQPVLERMLGSWKRGLEGVNLDQLAAKGAAILADKPLTYAELGKRLAPLWPNSDPDGLYRAVQVRVPLVQVPPRGVWGRSGSAKHAPLVARNAKEPGPPLNLEGLILRYLAAFGPASVQDAQAWCGLTRLATVFDQLGARLDRFSSPEGTPLYDVPTAPRPEADTPAPPRFLPVYDNLVLGFRNRSRVLGARVPVFPSNTWVRFVLIDGRLGATWQIQRGKDEAVLILKPFVHLSRDDRASLRDEGSRLLDWMAPAAGERKVRIVPLSGVSFVRKL